MDHAPTGPDDLRLVPGLRLVERDPGLLSVLGDDQTVTVADTPSVRRLLDVLTGRPAAPASMASVEAGDDSPDATSRQALAALATAGLTEPRTLAAATQDARRSARVLVDAPHLADARTTTALELLMASGLAVTTRGNRATHVLVVGRGDVDRGRIEEWSQRDIPHLVLVDRGSAVTLGPFVHPGLTSCLHCVEAHLRDPAHAEVAVRLAAGALLGPAAEPALAVAATAWAVRDLVAAVEGGRPSTWSATVTLRAERGSGLCVDRREWRRHPDCGCAWDDALRSG